jgi:hypothetical protein
MPHLLFGVFHRRFLLSKNSERKRSKQERSQKTGEVVGSGKLKKRHDPVIREVPVGGI